MKKIILLLLLSFSIQATEQCPEFIDSEENPTQTMPTVEFFYQAFTENQPQVFKHSSDYNARYQVVEGIWKSAIETCPSRLGDYRFTESWATGGTPQSPDLACLYTLTRYKSCPTGYTFDIVRTQCKIDTPGSCEIPPETCNDGFPPDLLGYPNCDRPPLQQCSDGSYLLETEICPSITDPEPDPEPNPDPEPTPNPDLDPLIQKISEFKEQEKDSSTQLLSKIDDLNNEVKSSSESLRSDITNSINSQTSSLQSSIEQLQSSNESSSNMLRDQVSQSISSLATSNQVQLGQLKSATDSQTVAMSEKLDDTNTHLENVSGLLNQIAENTSQCIPTPDNNYCGNECTPTPENKYCESPHGLTTEQIQNTLNSIDGFYTEELNTITTGFETKVNEFKDGSPLGPEMSESQLEAFMSYFTELIPSSGVCAPLVLYERNGKQYVITCEFSEKFKALFGWLLGLYTVLKLISILMTGIVPRTASHQSSLF